MALTVETGAASATADSYASLATIAAYATAHGLTFAIAGADEVPAEQAARRATVWLDATYRGRFTGRRKNGRAQALEWPRYDAWDSQPVPDPIPSDEVPREIVSACCEAAIREKASPGTLSPDVTPGQVERSVSVANAVSVEYAATASGVAGQRPISTVIDDILGSLLTGSREAARLFGVAVRG